MNHIAIAAPHEVDGVWKQVVGGISKACERSGEHNDLTAGELWQWCRSGHAFLVLIFNETNIKSASVWRFEDRNGQPVFRCLMLAGKDMAEWLEPGIEWIKQVAKENGAEWLVTTGRKGWLRCGWTQWGDDYAIEVT